MLWNVFVWTYQHLPHILIGAVLLAFFVDLWVKHGNHPPGRAAQFAYMDFMDRFGHLPAQERLELGAKMHAMARLRRIASEVAVENPRDIRDTINDLASGEAAKLAAVYGPAVAANFRDVVANSPLEDILYKDALRAVDGDIATRPKPKQPDWTPEQWEDFIAGMRVLGR